MKISILLLIFLSVFAGKSHSNDTPAPQAIQEFYTDPGSNAYKWVGLNGGSANAETIRTHIAEQAGGKWYGTQHDQPWGVQPVGDYVSDAAAAGQVPIVVAYNMYQRDCGGESNGGASSKQSYKAWIDDFASAIGDRKALVVLEPDALTQYLVCENIDKSARQELLAYAVNALATKATNAQVYLDAGNAEWPVDASSIAAALQEAGVDKIDGFALNVSNHYETYKSHDRAGTINYFLGTKAGYVVDTSRNGAGKTDTSENGWCNPSGARLGEHSKYTPEGPADAMLWLKVPGDSDGSCNYGEGIPAGQFSEKLAMALITGNYDGGDGGSGGNPYTPTEMCGNGFSVINSHALSGGTIYLLWSGSSGQNCVVTMKTSNTGLPSSVSASLQIEGGTKTIDSGNFSYYAGPVKKSASNQCVKWGGSVGSSSWESPFEHCGS